MWVQLSYCLSFIILIFKKTGLSFLEGSAKCHRMVLHLHTSLLTWCGTGHFPDHFFLDTLTIPKKIHHGGIFQILTMVVHMAYYLGAIMVPYFGPYIIHVPPCVVLGVVWAVQGLHAMHVPSYHNGWKKVWCIGGHVEILVLATHTPFPTIDYTNSIK